MKDYSVKSWNIRGHKLGGNENSNSKSAPLVCTKNPSATGAVMCETSAQRNRNNIFLILHGTIGAEITVNNKALPVTLVSGEVFGLKHMRVHQKIPSMIYSSVRRQAPLTDAIVQATTLVDSKVFMCETWSNFPTSPISKQPGWVYSFVCFPILLPSSSTRTMVHFRRKHTGEVPFSLHWRSGKHLHVI